MFRVLALLIILAGTPQVDLPDQSQAMENLIEVDNFQVIEEPIKDTEFISAKSALVIDLDSQVVLYEKNPNLQLPIASLSKLMTALVVLQENELSEIVTISAEVNEVIGSRIWLYPGEKITVENLLKGMLIQSGNDAAYELAKYNAGTLEEFSKKMNQKGLDLGLKSSHFLDPAGLDDENNYASVKDLALIAKHILKYDFVREVVSLREISIFSVDGKLEHTLRNTNKMLNESYGAKGLKTGTTDLAGECLITLIEVQGNDVLIIILGSEDRYTDAYNLLKYLRGAE